VEIVLDLLCEFLLSNQPSRRDVSFKDLAGEVFTLRGGVNLKGVEYVDGSDVVSAESLELWGAHLVLAADDNGRAPLGRWGRLERRSERYDSRETGVSWAILKACFAVLSSMAEKEKKKQYPIVPWSCKRHELGPPSSFIYLNPGMGKSDKARGYS